MKTLKIFSTIALLAVCVLCTSYNKEEFDYSNTKWYGIVGSNGSVILTFKSGTDVCLIETSVKEIISANKQNFDVRWTGNRYSFELYPIGDGQVTKQFEGRIERNKMFLTNTMGGGTGSTYELSRIELVQQ